MLHNAAFHQGLHCLQRQNQSSEEEIQFKKNITCDPSIFKMDYPSCIVCGFMENSIGLNWVNIDFYISESDLLSHLVLAGVYMFRIEK